MGTLLTQREKKKGHQSHRQRRDKDTHRGEGDTVHAKGEDKRTSFTLREKRGGHHSHRVEDTGGMHTEEREKRGIIHTEEEIKSTFTQW